MGSEEEEEGYGGRKSLTGNQSKAQPDKVNGIGSIWDG